MGFKPGRTFSLEFEGEMEGAEVKIRSGSIGDMEKLTTLKSTEISEVLDLFLKYAISWNFVAADGLPLPLEKEDILREVDEATMIVVFQEWWKASTGVSAPLGKQSTSGESSPEESIPTEVL